MKRYIFYQTVFSLIASLVFVFGTIHRDLNSIETLGLYFGLFVMSLVVTPGFVTAIRKQDPNFGIENNPVIILFSFLCVLISLSLVLLIKTKILS